MRQNRNQRRLCSADRDPSLRFFDPQRQENRSRTKFFSSLLVGVDRKWSMYRQNDAIDPKRHSVSYTRCFVWAVMCVGCR